MNRPPGLTAQHGQAPSDVHPDLVVINLMASAVFAADKRAAAARQLNLIVRGQPAWLAVLGVVAARHALVIP